MRRLRPRARHRFAWPRHRPGRRGTCSRPNAARPARRRANRRRTPELAQRFSTITRRSTRLPRLRCAIDDFVDILRRGRPIPDPFGIDDHQRTGAAETEATRRREADVGQPLGLDRLAQPIPQRLGAGRAAAAARMAGRTLRETGKHVMLVELRQLESRCHRQRSCRARRDALVVQQRREFARLEHLADDVGAADELALDVELRDRRPVRKRP